MRLVEGNLMSFEDVMAETKTMLAGVSKIYLSHLLWIRYISWIFGQGFETTANAGSYIVLMMAMHPTLQDQLFDEMRTIFASCDSPVGVEDVHQMIYTERFIKETLRLFPVVPLASRYADEDTNLGKFYMNELHSIEHLIWCAAYRWLCHSERRGNNFGHILYATRRNDLGRRRSTIRPGTLFARSYSQCASVCVPSV